MNSSPNANLRKPGSWRLRNWRTFFFLVFVLAFVLLGTSETVRHYQDRRFVREVAANAARQTDAHDEIAVIVALRDYVRQHVGDRDFSPDGRPLLRHTAAETLRSGKGFCGEGTRVFVNL